MKKLFTLLLLLTAITTTYSQSTRFGIKGGINFGSTGGLDTFSEFTENLSLDSESRLGYHVGVFGNLEFLGLFVQPEIVFTKLNTQFESVTNIDSSLSKIDIPLLFGVDIVGPFNLKVGPSFQYIIDNEIEGLNIPTEGIQDPESTFTIGYQLGLGVNIGRLGIDIRYEASFQDNTIISNTVIENSGFVADARPTQWILGLSYSLKKKKDD